MDIFGGEILSEASSYLKGLVSFLGVFRLGVTQFHTPKLLHRRLKAGKLRAPFP